MIDLKTQKNITRIKALQDSFDSTRIDLSQYDNELKRLVLFTDEMKKEYEDSLKVKVKELSDIYTDVGYEFIKKHSPDFIKHIEACTYACLRTGFNTNALRGDTLLVYNFIIELYKDGAYKIEEINFDDSLGLEGHFFMYSFDLSFGIKEYQIPMSIINEHDDAGGDEFIQYNKAIEALEILQAI